MVKDIAPGTSGSSSSFYANTRFKGMLYFAANDGVHGTELWRTDGTHAGTKLVADAWHGAHESDPYLPFPAGGSLFFIARDATHGYELWVSNGSSASTHLVKDLTPGSRFLLDHPLLRGAAAAIGSQVIFVASVGNHGYELWTSKGTAASTEILEEIGPGSSSADVQSVIRVGDKVFFRG